MSAQQSQMPEMREKPAKKRGVKKPWRVAMRYLRNGKMCAWFTLSRYSTEERAKQSIKGHRSSWCLLGAGNIEFKVERT